MKPATFACLLSTVLLVGSLTVRLFRPAQTTSTDPEIRSLEERYRSLAGFSGAMAEMDAKSERVTAALWTPSALESMITGLPPGWVARSIATEHRHGITFRRIAFSKEATLRDYPEFQRVLKKIEEPAATRIDSVTLTVNSDGRRFATALITATLPVSPTQTP
ncbi:MAG: hypothetical protein HUU20_28140 [Pirellulales bacterium]|nr:hypothetical protein [Pirellulales bacterium]